MDAIGGYFDLELTRLAGEPYYGNALALNSGRNALKHILKEQSVSHIYIPYYNCPAVLEPIEALGLTVGFYQLDEHLEIKSLDEIQVDGHLLYINYFGLKGTYIEELAATRDKLIIDNSQAFYDKPQSGIDTFYSPRKFFGVPGGGYVCGLDTEPNAENDIAYDRCQHLLIRTDLSAEKGYAAYQENEEKFVNRPIKRMSALTHWLLSGIDYEAVKRQRVANYGFLHERLAHVNSLQNLAGTPHSCPLVYPFKNENINRKLLTDQRIYVPQYWPNISDDLPGAADIEHALVDHLIALPIDQRYGITEMRKIIDVITQYA